MDANISTMYSKVTTASSDTNGITALTTADFNANSSFSIIFQGFLYGSIFIFGLIFNLCVILMIHRTRSLRTITNMWVTSLCTSQLLICLSSLPIILVSVIADRWIFGFQFCRIFGFYTTVFRTVSILSVAGIALDRHYVITRPFNTRFHKNTARMYIGLTWWSSVVSATPPLLGFGLYRYSSNSHTCGLSLPLGGSALAFLVLYFMAVYISSFLVSSVAYKQIYQVTKSQANKRKRPSVAGGLASGLEIGRHIGNPSVPRFKEVSPARRRLTAILNVKASQIQGSIRHRFSISSAHSTIDHRTAHTICLVLTLYVCTGIPYYVFGIYASSTLPDTKPHGTLSWIEFFTLWLSLSNAVWDPILYGMLNQCFRSRLRELVTSSQFGRLIERMKTSSRDTRGDNNNTVRENPTVELGEDLWRDTTRRNEGEAIGTRLSGINYDHTFACPNSMASTNASERRREPGFYIGDTPKMQSSFAGANAAKRQKSLSSRPTSIIRKTPSSYVGQPLSDESLTSSNSRMQRPLMKPIRHRISEEALIWSSTSQSDLSIRTCQHVRSKSVQYQKNCQSVNYAYVHHTSNSDKQFDLPGFHKAGSLKKSADSKKLKRDWQAVNSRLANAKSVDSERKKEIRLPLQVPTQPSPRHDAVISEMQRTCHVKSHIETCQTLDRFCRSKRTRKKCTLNL